MASGSKRLEIYTGQDDGVFLYRYESYRLLAAAAAAVAAAPDARVCYPDSKSCM